MLVGHYAPALALKRVAPSLPLWALFLAAQAVDLLFFGLVFVGAEAGALHPGERPRFSVVLGIYSHSLVMTAGWAAATFAVGAALRHPREGAILALAVGAHWFLDLAVHVPDLPLAFDQTVAVGLGLWRQPVLAWLLECGLLLGAGLWLARANLVPRKALQGLVAGLIVLQTLSDFLIPLPPDDHALGISAYALYLGAAYAAGRIEWRLPRSAP